MVEVVRRISFKCSVCGQEFASEEEAKACQDREVRFDKGVKEGDKVRILNGEGRGLTATVTRVFVVKKDWGHYFWERYWHTVSVLADVDGCGGGSRLLLFDDYEPIHATL